MDLFFIVLFFMNFVFYGFFLAGLHE
jgi:hypothetical protein